MAATRPAAQPELKPSDLEAFELLRHLPPDHIEELIAQGKQSELLAGETLITGGDSPHHMYLLLAGRLHVYRRSGESEPLATLLSGEVVGELSILDPTASSGHVVAADDCRVLAVSDECFWNLLGSSHAFALNLLLRLARRVRSSDPVSSGGSSLAERFERAALFDPLTNLNNRRWLESTLPRIVDRHVMESRPLSLAVIEIDGFPELCDELGLDIGDRVLAASAILLRSRLRPTDHIVRHLGGRFVLVLGGSTLAVAHRAAKRVRDGLRALKLRAAPAGMPEITASIGLAELETAQSAAALLARAEAALHRAKQSGPNSCAA